MKACQCGTRMVIRGSLNWCSHCDEPHKPTTAREKCAPCDNARAAEGIGPKSR